MEAERKRGTCERISRKEKRVRRIRRTLYILLAIWGILGFIGVFTIVQWIYAAVSGTQEQAYGNAVYGSSARSDHLGESEADATSMPGDEPQTEMGMGQDTGSKAAEVLSEEDRRECLRLYREYPSLLMIANKEYELSPDYDPMLRSICNGRLQAASVMYDDLVDMLRAAGNEGYEYWIASAYRSRERQQELIDEDVTEYMQEGMTYEAALAKTLEETLPAGHSEHETGLSLDILCSGNTQMDLTQANEPGNRWLVEHCAEYGFILRYPKDKENVTGIAFEPWHFRYVGKEAAQFMSSRGLTLEEFFIILKNPL